mmetsp:Transcript_12751/g.21788  ORF Transcript_12751/g.21788 Transcript_12751/m.21788 type:complete len:235 (+) Transcript_12751:182-886(+)
MLLPSRPRNLLLELCCRHRRREHAVAASDGRLLVPKVGRGHAVRQRDGVEPLLVRRSHRALDAAVGEEPAEHYRLDLVGHELLLEVRVREGVEPLLARDHDVARLRLHLVAELGVPCAFSEELAVGAASEDADLLVRVVHRVLLEHDRDEHHLGTRLAARGCYRRRLIEHVRLFNRRLDCVVQLATLGGELILRGTTASEPQPVSHPPAMQDHIWRTAGGGGSEGKARVSPGTR